jgi:hypothetical protein
MSLFGLNGKCKCFQSMDEIPECLNHTYCFPLGLHLVDQYLITFINKGGFKIVKNRVNIL